MSKRVLVKEERRGHCNRGMDDISEERLLCDISNSFILVNGVIHVILTVANFMFSQKFLIISKKCVQLLRDMIFYTS